MKYYYGTGHRGPYFEGWYLKHQGSEGSLAVIPAIHQQRSGDRTASIQVITPKGTKTFSFPEQSFQAWPDRFQVRIGENWFSQEGVHLDLEDADFSLKGELQYGPFTPLDTDIMGPFRWVPGLQCVHGVLSMGHQVDGVVSLNGETSLFSHGTGYLETDRGRSFPRTYLWTQCTWVERQRGSIMLSVADIPMGVGRFTGCICEIHYGGRSHRMATYHGVKIQHWSEEGAVITQGDMKLAVELKKKDAQPLQAPTSGNMTRTIHESLCATVRYRFWMKDTLLFDHTDECASYEYANEAPKRRSAKVMKAR